MTSAKSCGCRRAILSTAFAPYFALSFLIAVVLPAMFIPFAGLVLPRILLRSARVDAFAFTCDLPHHRAPSHRSFQEPQHEQTATRRRRHEPAGGYRTRPRPPRRNF